MSKVVDRFLRYVKFDTKSCEESESFPSTKGQMEFAKKLKGELENLGLEEITLDKNGYLMATIPSNMDRKVKTVGFIAHMDTSPDMSGENVNPRFVENYDGEDIILNKEENIVLSPKDFPDLRDYVGKTLIVTDGKTLLGADDKAGVAEIISAAEYLMEHKEIKHGKIRIGFTPDEEVGRGADRFDVKKFNADFAYTADGGEIGGFAYENFNAAGFKLVIKGRNVHPGSAKNKMINSITLSNEFIGNLPENEVPEKTEGYEGFYHLTGITGNVEETVLQYIIRDFDKENFEKRKETVKKLVDNLNKKYGEGTFILSMHDQYYNMKEKFKDSMYIVDIAKKSSEEIGVKFNVTPIRGGTDGARLSYMGLPTPNLFTGGHNYHGKFEYIPTFAMEKAYELILKIIENTANM